MRRLLMLLFLLAFAGSSVSGQTKPEADQSELIKALLQRLDTLEKRVADLEGRKASPSEAPAAASVIPATYHPGTPAGSGDVVHTQEHVMNHAQDVAPLQEVRYPSLKFSGFSDVNFSATDQSNPGSNSGFNLGQFILHMASPLSKKVSFFGEISFTALPTGFNAEVERSIIRYDYNDAFKLSFGRYHTPINYWNTAYHHGLWLQTTISRPEMIQFGGRFQPVHFVGLAAEGSIPSGGANLGYNVGVGNGRGLTISRAGDAGDVNNNRALLINVFSRPARIYGLQVGASVYRDKITTAAGPSFREWIASAHLVWMGEAPEFLAEFANVHHSQISSGPDFNSQAFYVQLAYKLPWQDRKWKPYYRFEYINTPTSEPVLNVSDLVGSTLGVRYDITDYAAFKGEYRNSLRNINPNLKARTRMNGLFFQTSFTF